MSWWPVGLAVALGGAAAAWLRRGGHLYLDDETFLPVPAALVPIVAGLAVLPAVGRTSDRTPTVVTITFVVALVWALVVVAVDLEVGRVPDVLTLPGYLVAAVLLTVCSIVTDDGAALARAAACAGLGVCTGALGLRSGVTGAGDVKLSGVIGALLGWVSWSVEFYALGLAIVICWAVISAFLKIAALRRSIRSGRLVVVAPALVLSAYATGLYTVINP